MATSTSTSGTQVEVLARKSQNLRVFVLNRPQALNALNLNMVQLMTPQLKDFVTKAWDESDLTKSILLMGVDGCKGFCSGGDVKDIVTKSRSRKPEDIAQALKFFEEEYKLNHLIGTLKKPFVSLMNGITMGGGVGISVHAPFRIVTENTMFAMPETGIGLFPDVGGSFFLPRLDGELGTYLGLTGHRLKGEEVMYAGIGTHFVPSQRIPQLLARLSDIESDELEVINMAIEEFVGETNADAWKNWSLGGDVADAINRCFKGDDLETIVEALTKENTPWSEKTLETLKTMSPTSLKVTLEQLRRGKKMDFASCLRMEYNMVQEFLRTPDFHEGVTALLIEKRKPIWNPTWAEMTDSLPRQLIQDAYFTPKKPKPSTRAPDARLPKPTLEFLNDRTYFEYPHRTLSSLPREQDIERVIEGKVRRGITNAKPTKDEHIVDLFVQQWGSYDKELMGTNVGKLPVEITIENGFGRGKVGLREKVVAYLARRKKN
ncbi:hypothetical protein HDV05_004158 [Chytridiales sp. JEL 0842]|nr:hypothetical protein HDV05_004158 [Chytridiales sp. JEL 0842]